MSLIRVYLNEIVAFDATVVSHIALRSALCYDIAGSIWPTLVSFVFAATRLDFHPFVEQSHILGPAEDPSLPCSLGMFIAPTCIMDWFFASKYMTTRLLFQVVLAQPFGSTGAMRLPGHHSGISCTYGGACVMLRCWFFLLLVWNKVGTATSRAIGLQRVRILTVLLVYLVQQHCNDISYTTADLTATAFSLAAVTGVFEVFGNVFGLVASVFILLVSMVRA